MRELSTNAIQRAGGMIQDLPGSIDWCSWPIWTQETTWGYDKTRSTWFVSWRHKIDQNTVLFGIYRWGNLPRNYWLLGKCEIWQFHVDFEQICLCFKENCRIIIIIIKKKNEQIISMIGNLLNLTCLYIIIWVNEQWRKHHQNNQ